MSGLYVLLSAKHTLRNNFMFFLPSRTKKRKRALTANISTNTETHQREHIFSLNAWFSYGKIYLFQSKLLTILFLWCVVFIRRKCERRGKKVYWKDKENETERQTTANERSRERERETQFVKLRKKEAENIAALRVRDRDWAREGGRERKKTHIVCKSTA